jgi:5-formyltetrahydrofolate cyclo-ligase
MVVPPTPAGIGTDRNLLRRRLKLLRQHYVLQHKKSPALRDELILALSAATKIGVYVPIGSEAHPDIITAWCRENGKTLFLPCFPDSDSDMVFRIWHAADPLKKGPFGFGEPSSHSAQSIPDLIIVPLVGFDRDLNRIGQGKGHFDRYFAQHPSPIRIGLAFSVQEVDALPVAPWDIPLHGVMTEREWISKNA